MNLAMPAAMEMHTESEMSPIVFTDLQLASEVQLAVQLKGYTSPTPIQAEIIPLMLAGQDILAQSQTGTGKTAAFALPILSKIDVQLSQTQVLVLAPTRELATQVAQSFESYGCMLPKLRVAAIYGGADYEPQLKMLRRGAHVVVGTPGRVIDHIRRGSLNLESVRCLVLDEADEMLNMGFIDDVGFVLEQVPQPRQTALFSATLPAPIRDIAARYLIDPAQISIRKKTLTADNIEQRCVFVDDNLKLELLTRILESEPTDGVIVFAKTKDATNLIADQLVQRGQRAAALNGDLPQARRQQTVDQLRKGQINVLVATDVAARGLDVQRISHVINYDLPHDGESYVHRIGRTGRAGRKGIAVIFLTPRQRSKLAVIERLTKQTIEIVSPPSASKINHFRVARFEQEIVQTVNGAALKPFESLVQQVMRATGLSAEAIAAAVLHNTSPGRPLFVEEIESWCQSRRSSHDKTSVGRQRDESRRSPRDVAPPRKGMLRYRIEVGRTDGVRVGNIVGAIANEAGLCGNDIGPIEIRQQFTTVDLPSELPSDILKTIGRTWVAGKQLRIRPFFLDQEIAQVGDSSRRETRSAGRNNTQGQLATTKRGRKAFRTGTPKRK